MFSVSGWLVSACCAGTLGDGMEGSLKAELVGWFFLSLGETSVYTPHFDLNSRCHGLPPNDTQHHTPDRLNEFFALCPHFK